MNEQVREKAREMMGYAVARGDVAKCEQLLKSGFVSADGSSLSTMPFLHLAAHRGRRSVVELLLAAGASPDARCPFGTTALDRALMAREHGRDEENVVELLEPITRRRRRR